MGITLEQNKICIYRHDSSASTILKERVPHLSIFESSLGDIMEEMGFCVHKIGLKRSPKVKSAMALYLKIHFMRCTNYVQSVMLLSKSAQVFAMLLYYVNECYYVAMNILIGS